MKILIIHDLPPVTKMRRQLVNHGFFYPKYRPETEVVLHAVGEPLSEAITDAHYDAIFLDTTFLCWRWANPRSALSEILQKYSWVAKNHSPKIAFPQDDYDHQEILDQWLFDWNVDVVCTPLAEFKEVLYPKALTRAEILPFQTGFIDDVDLKIGAAFGVPLSERSVDVVYRARPLPANFGQLGRLKTLVAERMEPKLRSAGFKTDISTDPGATVFGDNWLSFLGSSRFVLGSPSGSSVLDPVGSIGRTVRDYMAENPEAAFDEVYSSCIPNDAARHWMAAISPRCLEAALTRTCQVLVRGEYGPLEADRHYIPIEPDFSNLDNVIERMGDLAEAQRIADNCYALVTTTPSLHYRSAADLVDEALARIRTRRNLPELPKREGVSTEQVVEAYIRARLQEKQLLVADMAQALGDEVTGAPIEIMRFSELIDVLEDRWRRLASGLQEAQMSLAQVSADSRRDIEEAKDLLEKSTELKASNDYLKASNENLSAQYESISAAYHQLLDNYAKLDAVYTDLYNRPGALIRRLYELCKQLLLGRDERKA